MKFSSKTWLLGLGLLAAMPAMTQVTIKGVIRDQKNNPVN
jgi:hypothetical protein